MKLLKKKLRMYSKIFWMENLSLTMLIVLFYMKMQEQARTSTLRYCYPLPYFIFCWRGSLNIVFLMSRLFWVQLVQNIRCWTKEESCSISFSNLFDVKVVITSIFSLRLPETCCVKQRKGNAVEKYLYKQFPYQKRCLKIQCLILIIFFGTYSIKTSVEIWKISRFLGTSWFH